MTTDLLAYFNQHTGKDLTPLFDEYLRHAAIPLLQLKFDAALHTVGYRWRAEEAAFNMPVRVGRKDDWQLIFPTTEWKTLDSPIPIDEFEVATDLYYIDVSKQT